MKASLQGEERPLGVIEYFMNKLYGQVIWCILDVRGPLSKATLEAAVVATVKRHAMLRARIAPKRRLLAPSFEEFMAEHPKLVVEEAGATAAEVTERELARGALKDGRTVSRLWSMFLTGEEGPQADRAVVLLTNHAISDGSSLVLWLQEIVANCNKLIAEKETPASLLAQGTPVPLCPAFESRIKSWPESRLRRLSMQWAATRLGIMLKGCSMPKPEVEGQERRTRIVTHLLTPEETEALLQRVKSNGTTVAGAVGAAALLAVRGEQQLEVKMGHGAIPSSGGGGGDVKHSGEQRMMMIMGHDATTSSGGGGHDVKHKDRAVAAAAAASAPASDAANTGGGGCGVSKKRLPPLGLQVNLCLRPNAVMRGCDDLRESLGNTSVPIFRAITPERAGVGLWPLAKSVRAEISRGVRTGEWVESIKEMAYSRLTSKWTINVTIKHLHEKYANGRLGGVSLSSMGDLDANLRADLGDAVQAQSCWAGIDVGQLGPYLMVVCLTLNGRIGFSVSVAEPVVTPDRAERMMRRMVGALLEA